MTSSADRTAGSRAFIEFISSLRRSNIVTSGYHAKRNCTPRTKKPPHRCGAKAFYRGSTSLRANAPQSPLTRGNADGYCDFAGRAHSRTFTGAFRSALTNAPLSGGGEPGYSDWSKPLLQLSILYSILRKISS